MKKLGKRLSLRAQTVRLLLDRQVGAVAAGVMTSADPVCDDSYRWTCGHSCVSGCPIC